MTRCEYCYRDDRPTHGILTAGLKGFTERQICDVCEAKYARIATTTPVKTAKRRRREHAGFRTRSQVDR